MFYTKNLILTGDKAKELVHTVNPKGVVDMRSFQHIAKLIRNKRVSHPQKYSQSELSNLLGYKNGQFISNVERGLCSIPLKMLNKVSDVLNIHPHEIKEAILQDHSDTLDAYLSKKNIATVVEVKRQDTAGESKNSTTDIHQKVDYSSLSRALGE